MRRSNGLIIFVFLLSCSTTNVVHFTNSASEFQRYQTFKLTNFKADPELSVQGKSMFEGIERNILDQMASRKYISVDKNPDILLRYELVSNSETQVNVNRNLGYRSFYSPYFYDISTRDLTKSMLLVEMLDVKTKKLIWQGSLDLKYAQRSKKVTEWLTNAVNEIFSTYRYEARNSNPQ